MKALFMKMKVLDNKERVVFIKVTQSEDAKVLGDKGPKRCL